MFNQMKEKILYPTIENILTKRSNRFYACRLLKLNLGNWKANKNEKFVGVAVNNFLKQFTRLDHQIYCECQASLIPGVSSQRFSGDIKILFRCTKK